MALNDLTGQNIQDTYQKVVQTDGTNLADGTGSLLPISFDGNDVTISGSLTANEYIVSSSVTNITVATLSGSTNFGDDTNDTHKFTGSLHLKGGSGSPVKITSNGYTWNIGNVSAISTLGRQNDLANYALGSTTSVTYLNAALSGDIRFLLGNNEKMRLISNGDLGIGVSLPSEKLHVAGNLKVNGNTFLGDAITDNHIFSGNVTASNNLKVVGNTTLGDALTDIHLFSGHVTASNNLQTFGNTIFGKGPSNTHEFHGNITASGLISQSGVTGENILSTDLTVYGRFRALGSTFDTLGGNITSSGNISASGNIVAGGITASSGAIIGSPTLSDDDTITSFVAEEAIYTINAAGVFSGASTTAHTATTATNFNPAVDQVLNNNKDIHVWFKKEIIDRETIVVGVSVEHSKFTVSRNG